MFYSTYTIYINITRNGGQAMDEEWRNVQMSSWSKHTDEGSKQQQGWYSES